MEFKKAERKRVKLKIGIAAPSGAGKTYSALLIAKGLCGGWNKIAVIDTENGSAELYSDLGEYSTLTIAPPFTPTKCIEAIKLAEANHFEVLIIDGLSPFWTGEGGLLDMQDKAAKASKSGNSYTAWREITPEHNRLVDTILQCDMDVIVTLRAKTEYVITEDGNGKKTPKKVGMAPVFRDGLEYEFTTMFDMTQEHIATASKDRTGMFDRQNFIPSVETGELFNQWRAGGRQVQFITEEQKKILKDYGTDFDKLVQYYKHSTIDQLTMEEAQEAIDRKQKAAEAKAQKDAEAAKKAAENAKLEDEAQKAFPKSKSDEPDYDDPEWQ